MINSDNNTNNLIVSGNQPQNPVVSIKSGSIFEHDLLKEYIEQNGKDPINNEEMSIDDILPINVTQKITPPRQLNSIPQLLSSLQNEYDSMALEMFNLRKVLEDTRKELSTALYHHDAATRVASRLLQERDEARKALQELTTNLSGDSVDVNNNNGGANDSQIDVPVVDVSIPEEISEAITQANQDLFALHKQQKNKVNVDVDYNFEKIDEETKKAKPYDSIISSNVTKTDIIITGKTGKSSSFNIESNKIIKLESITQSKDITSILSLGNDSEDYLIGTKKGELKFNKLSLNTNHKSSIISILQHPSLSNIIISIDQTGLLSIINLEQKAVIFNNTVIKDSAIVADIHLDGALVAIGNTLGEISIVDLRSGQVVSTLSTNINSSVLDLKFGDNGYWLFASYEGKIFEIWDLRKNTSFRVNTNSNIKKITFEKSSQLILGVDINHRIEFIQYFKSDKSWKLKNELEIKKLSNVIVIDDTEKNKLKLLAIKETSEISEIVL